MERTSIRAWRRIQQKRVWRNRLKYYANIGHQIVDDKTHQWYNPRDWKEYRKEPWTKILKTTATPCSCWLCRNYLYNREDFKRDTNRILREELED